MMETHLVEPLFFTVGQTQRLLGIQRSKFYSEVSEGRLKIVKNGSRTFVHRDEIQRYADNLLKQ